MVVLTRSQGREKSNQKLGTEDFSPVVLELISVFDKEVLCLAESENLTTGLKIRGARVAHDTLSQKQLSGF